LAALARKQKTNTASAPNSLAAVRTNARVICLFTMSKISPPRKPWTGTEYFIKRTCLFFSRIFSQELFSRDFTFKRFVSFKHFSFESFVCNPRRCHH